MRGLASRHANNSATCSRWSMSEHVALCISSCTIAGRRLQLANMRVKSGCLEFCSAACICHYFMYWDRLETGAVKNLVKEKIVTECLLYPCYVREENKNGLLCQQATTPMCQAMEFLAWLSIWHATHVFV